MNVIAKDTQKTSNFQDLMACSSYFQKKWSSNLWHHDRDYCLLTSLTKMNRLVDFFRLSLYEWHFSLLFSLIRIKFQMVLKWCSNFKWVERFQSSYGVFKMRIRNCYQFLRNKNFEKLLFSVTWKCFVQLMTAVVCACSLCLFFFSLQLNS